MAKMIPQDITHLPPNTTKGEKALYRIIERYTPDDWICYVGQRLKPGSTPDFVLIGSELGILILEEKSIPKNLIKDATTELWTVIRDGSPKKETHPLRQARGYVEKTAQEMRKFKRLQDDRGRLKFVYGHGVVLSNISKQEISNDTLFDTALISTFEPHLLICKDELPPSTGKPRENTDFSERLLEMTKMFKFKPLDDQDMQTIRGALYPEVRARFLGDEMRDRNEALEALTIEQEQIARGIGQNDKVPHRLVRGVAGSGKSVILRVRAMDVAISNPEWKILLTFFTRSLTGYLGHNMPLNVEVMTIGQALYKQWKEHHLDDDDFDPTTEEGWKKLADAFDENRLSKGGYQAIFVDEAQDLTNTQVDCLRYLLDEETNCAFFCGDEAQKIFRKKNINWSAHGFQFKGRSSKKEFLCNYRGTQEIFDFAWEFIKDHTEDMQQDDDNEEGNSLIVYEKIEFKRHGPTPRKQDYSSEEEEVLAVIKEIARLIKVEKTLPGSIAILHPNATKQNRKIIEPYMQWLSQENIPFYWLSESWKTKSDYSQSANMLTISTPDSGKGLEWDIVFMPALNRYTGDNPDKLGFVAATRARQILYPSTSP